MTDRLHGPDANESEEIRYDPGGVPMGLVGILVVILCLGVWQFISLVPEEKDYPSDTVDVAIRGNDVVVYNPTHEIVDVYKVTVQRLSGSYSYTDRNLRPDSIRRISLRKLTTPGGARLRPDEEGECRVRLEYWRGRDREDLFRYCRGF